MRFNHGPAHVPPQPFPNRATRSRKATLVGDLSSLTLCSHLRLGSVLSEGAKPSCVPNVANKQSELAVINHQKAMPNADARPATTDIGLPARDKLEQAIERCKESYWGKIFVVSGDERSKTVLPDEIDRFFSCFQEEEWLANFNLMPLLFSFRWPSTTLVLHSSYTSFTALKNGNQQSSTRVRWPIRRDHDRVILPCCFQSHWTLYDVDLKHNSIRHYNSLTGDVSKPEEIVSAIKERLAYAMEG